VFERFLAQHVVVSSDNDEVVVVSEEAQITKLALPPKDQPSSEQWGARGRYGVSPNNNHRLEALPDYLHEE
jgi:hypothetical protein